MHLHSCLGTATQEVFSQCSFPATCFSSKIISVFIYIAQNIVLYMLLIELKNQLTLMHELRTTFWLLCSWTPGNMFNILLLWKGKTGEILLACLFPLPEKQWDWKKHKSNSLTSITNSVYRIKISDLMMTLITLIHLRKYFCIAWIKCSSFLLFFKF